MFDQPGIGTDDIPWIQRDQFVYYLEMERALSDPTDWDRFRGRLLHALQAAFGIDLDTTAILQLLDRLATTHDPAGDWLAFADALWDQRRHMRPDL